jgi:hypothetical protein
VTPDSNDPFSDLVAVTCQLRLHLGSVTVSNNTCKWIQDNKTHLLERLSFILL